MDPRIRIRIHPKCHGSATLPQGLPDPGGEGGTAEGRAGQLAEQPGERAAGVHKQRGMRQLSPGVQSSVRSGSRYY